MRPTFLAIGAGAVLSSIGCAEVDLEMVHQPRFTTGSANYPPRRAGYPAGPWSQPTPDQTSGYDYMMRFIPEDDDEDLSVVQRTTLTGVFSATTVECGDTPIPIGVARTEYFKSPANDMQAIFFAPAEGFYSLRVTGIVGSLELPGNPPVIEPTQNVQFLDDAYLATLTPDERAELDPARLKEASYLRWRHWYNYDGCHNDPDEFVTFCAARHCLEHVWRIYDDGRPGAANRTLHSGPGQAW